MKAEFSSNQALSLASKSASTSSGAELWTPGSVVFEVLDSGVEAEVAVVPSQVGL